MDEQLLGLLAPLAGFLVAVALGSVSVMALRRRWTANRRPAGEDLAPRRRQGWMIPTLGLLVSVVLGALAILSANQAIAIASVRQRYPPPGSMINVDNRAMHLHCTGSGSPTMVIDAGNACFSLEWAPVQERVAETTRVCTYDRAGYGWSEPGPDPRDGANVVSDLWGLLHAAGEPGPYLLVGHSLGGLHMRLFVAQYPREVVGLVLIDTAAETGVTPELQAQMQASIGFYRATALLTATGLMRVIGPLMGESAMPETARKLPPELQEPYLELVMDSRYQATAADEMTQLPETLRQVSAVMRDPAPLGDRPLIVLTAGQQMAPGASPFSEQRVAVDAAVVAAQGRLAGLSSRGEQRIVEESGHQMHLDASEAVVQAIRDAIEQARN